MYNSEDMQMEGVDRSTPALKQKRGEDGRPIPVQPPKTQT